MRQEVASQQRIYQLLQFKADLSLVKANISALRERERSADRLRREAAEVAAREALAEVMREEVRLKATIVMLEKKRAGYAAAKESCKRDALSGGQPRA